MAKDIGFNVKVGGLDQVKGALGQALDGVNVFGQGLTSLFKVILTNPIGIIITAVTGLIAAFKKLDPVVDFLEQAMAGLNAVFDTLIGSIGGFIKDLASGKGIVDAFTDNIANMGDKMVDAYNAASDLAKAIQELEDAQNAYTVSSAEAEAQQAKLLAQARNVNLSAQEKIKLIKQASEIEKQNHEQALAIAKEQERIALAELAQLDKNMMDRGDAAKKAAEMTAARIRLEGESAAIQEKLENRMDQIREQAAAKEQARKDKERAEREKAEAEKQKAAEAEFKRISDLAKARQMQEDERAALELAEIEAANRADERAKNTHAIAVSLMTDATAKKKAELDIQEQNELDNLVKNYTNQEEFERLRTELNTKYENARLQVDVDAAKAKSEMNQKQLEGYINATQATLNAVSGAFSQNTVAYKVAKVAETTVSTYTSATKAFDALAGIPYVGPVLGGIAAAAAIASGIANVNAILNTPVPKSPQIKIDPGAARGQGSGSSNSGGTPTPPPPVKSMFANGGLLVGNRHANGGILSPFGELEGGEMVINRRSTAAFLPMLESINAMGEQTGAIANNDPRIDQLLDSRMNSNQSPIVKTYVVADDMISQLQARKKIDDLSTL